MRAVMEGGFRPIVLAEVFRRFPDFIDAEKAGELKLSVGFRIGGRADGEVDRYVVHVADGVCTIETSPPEGQRRDATITVEGADFLRLATGQLHPVRGVLTGALKVKGDRAKALALNAVMVPPGTAEALAPDGVPLHAAGVGAGPRARRSTGSRLTAHIRPSDHGPAAMTT